MRKIGLLILFLVFNVNSLWAEEINTTAVKSNTQTEKNKEINSSLKVEDSSIVGVNEKNVIPNTKETKQQWVSTEKIIKDKIEKILVSQSSSGYAVFPKGIQVLNVGIDSTNKITINLSKELLSDGTGSIFEDAVHQILGSLSDDVPENKNNEYQILIEGSPLQEYFNKK